MRITPRFGLERELRGGCECSVSRPRHSGARLMFISTDYVFDGTKGTPYETSDARHPVSVYGETKARAEARLLDIVPDVCIVRTSWLFGRGGKCFPETMLKLAATKPGIHVVNDQRGSPTYTRDLAAALVELCRKQARGIVHATNAGDCTWFEFAREIVQRAGLAAEVKPIDTAGFPRPARRPAYSVLSPESLHAYGIRMPDWQRCARAISGGSGRDAGHVDIGDSAFCGGSSASSAAMTASFSMLALAAEVLSSFLQALAPACLQRELTPDHLHRGIVRGQAAFELRIFHGGQNFLEARAGFVSGGNQVVAGYERRGPDGLWWQ